MPDNLIDNPAVFPTPIQAPAFGDPRTDTSVATPFQQLANRTANLAAQLALFEPYTAAGYAPALPAGVTAGVSGLLTATTLAALASIPAANRTDQMQCAVSSVNGSTFSPGLYVYSALSTATPVTNVVIEPADTVGRWFLQNYGALNAANGIAQCDPTGRVAAANVRNGPFYENFSQTASTSVTATAGALTTVLSGTAIPGVLVNDIIHVDFQALVTLSTSGVNFLVYPTISVPGTGVIANTWWTGEGPLTLANCQPFGSFTASAAGTYTPLVQVFVSGTTSSTIQFVACELRVRIIRP